jgi:hypothetical protein
LIALAVFLVFLWFASAAGSAYAAGSSEPQWLWTGGDGGGGSPPPPSDKIEGYVYQYLTGTPVSNVTVYLAWTRFTEGACGPYYYTVTPVRTSSSGYFEFTNSIVESYGCAYGIWPSTTYYISVNGYYDPVDGYFDPLWCTTDLGVACDNPARGQWLGNVTTNSNGYAEETIALQSSAVVNVTEAALYSDTKYATLYYGTESDYQVEHSLSFSVEGIISTGYTTSMNTTYSSQFWTAPDHAEIIYLPYYAASYLDANLGIGGQLVS